MRHAMIVVALTACSARERDGVDRDTMPAAPPTAAPATATVVSVMTPLAHDSVVTAPGDTGVRVGADGRLRFPMVFAASCEGEDCQTAFTGLACAAVELHALPDTAAPVVARVARGDSIHVRRTDLHVLKPGIVVVKQAIVRASETPADDDRTLARSDTLRLAPGDTVYLLQYEQLGDWRYWWKGTTTDGGQFWGSPVDDDALGSVGEDTSRAVARSQPVTDQWWLLDDGARPTGWWRADSSASLRSVYNMEHWDEHCPGWRPAVSR